MNSQVTKTRKILIMAGGTGGHVYPALSIAEYLQQQGVTVEWLGTEQGLEARVIPARNILLHTIDIQGLRGKGLGQKLAGPWRILRSTCQALSCIWRRKPDCVLGMGGYVTGPGGLAAWLLRKPLLIHEQNAIAGFSNQALNPFARVVMEAFSGAFARKQAITESALMKRFIRLKKVVVVGNPVRQEIIECGEQRLEKAVSTGRLKVLVLGGSLGAQAINQTVPVALATMQNSQDLEVWHQCGPRHLQQTLEAYAREEIKVGGRIRVEAYIEDMAEAYAWADTVVCRSGAITVAELAVAGVGAVLVPYPHAVDDHQTENAKTLLNGGAAVLVPQDMLDAEVLGKILEDLQKDRSKVVAMAKAARLLGQPDATQRAVNFCLEACHG